MQTTVDPATVKPGSMTTTGASSPGGRDDGHEEHMTPGEEAGVSSL